MEEKISVVMPVYNAEKYLKRALDSILNQTFPVYEIICVDDGSTDGSLDILKKYALKDARINVIHKENGGSTSARKAGILMAKGKYASFVDSDDFIEPIMYEEMMALAVTYDADLVTSGLIRDYGTSTTFENEAIKPGVYTKERIKLKILPFLVDRQYFYKANLSPHIVNMIFRTNLLQSVQKNVDDRIIVGDDDSVIYPFLFRSNTVVVSGKNYYHYCIRENGSIMGVRKPDDCNAYNILFRHLEKEFQLADKPEFGLMKQFQLLKTYFLMLRFPSQVLRYYEDILYPFGKLKKMDKILLYGAGKFGVEMKSYLESQDFCVVGWADKSANRPGIIRPEEIHNIDFDIVIITVLIADAVRHIRKDLERIGIPEGDILYADARMIE